MRVLIDNSVLRDAVVGQWVMVEHSVQWGGRAVRSKLTKFERRPLPPEDQAQRLADISCVATIKRLALTGVIQCCLGREVKFESMTGGDPAAGTIGDLLSEVKLENVDSPIERSFFQGTINLSKYLARDAVIDFCAMLLAVKDEHIERILNLEKDFPESTLRGIRDLPRFRKLCVSAPRKHYPDLFHLWTAEHAGCEFFLTMDKKFVNFGTNQCTGILKCEPVRPSMFLERIGVADRDPMPFDFGDPISFFDAVHKD